MISYFFYQSRAVLGWLVLTGMFILPLSSSLLTATAYAKEACPVQQKLESMGQATGYPELKAKLKERGLSITPYFKTRMDYTNNVFFAAQDRKDEVIWYFTPGITGNYKTDRSTLNFGYEADFDYFTKYPKQNEQNQAFFFSGITKPTDNTYITAEERFLQRGAVAADPGLEPVNIRDNTVKVAGGYIMDDWTFHTGYENFDRDFQNETADRYSYNENKGEWLVYKRLTPRIRAFTGYKLGFVDFQHIQSRDTTWHEFPLGMETTLGHGTRMQGSVGFHRRNLESDARNDLTYVVGNLALKKDLNARTSAELGFWRRPVESSYENQTVYDEKTYYLEVRHFLNSRTRARLGSAWGNRDFEESSFTGTRFAVGPANFVNSAQVQERTDTFWDIKLGMDYSLTKWMTLNLDYRHSRRDSNVPYFDATEHRLSFGTALVF